jgi:hypothetical protein
MHRLNNTIIVTFIIIISFTLTTPQLYNKTIFNDSNINVDLANLSSWIITLENSSWNVEGIVTDALENSYIAGVVDLKPSRYDPSQVVSIFFSKYNSTGHEKWTTKIDFYSSFEYFFLRALEIDSENNIYSLWYSYLNGTFLIKFNSSGSLIWKYNIKDPFNDVHIDTNGNIILLGQTLFNSENLRLVQINKTGVMEFNYSISMSYSISPLDLRKDEINEIYIATHLFPYGNLSIFKFNYSIEVILLKTLDQINRNYRCVQFFDDYGNLFATDYDTDKNSNTLFKYNSSYDKIFSRTWKSYSPMVYESFSWDRVKVDSFGNFFCAGLTSYYNLMAFTEIFLVKYTKNGTLEGQYMWRKFHNVISLGDIHIDQQNNLYFVGIIEEGSFIVKNPILQNYKIDIFYFYIDEETLVTVIQLSIFFGIWSLLGISLFIYNIIKGKRG